MRIKHLFLAAGTILALCAGCVDPDYKIDDLEFSGVIFRNMEVPIGNFEEVTLNTILEAPGSEVITLRPGVYSLEGSADLEGFSLKFSSDLYFKKAELHTVILNTLPLDLSFRIEALDGEGQPCPDVTVTVIADRTPAIASGKKGQPSSNPVVLRLECPGYYAPLETLRLHFTGQTGQGFENEAPRTDEGITLTQVVLKMPDGFQVNL